MRSSGRLPTLAEAVERLHHAVQDLGSAIYVARWSLFATVSIVWLAILVITVVEWARG